MLGGIKVKGDDGAGVPLFRILARRWVSLAPVKRKRVRLSSKSPADQHAEPTRRWISKPRLVAPPVPPADRKSRSSWNPWMWMK